MKKKQAKKRKKHLSRLDKIKIWFSIIFRVLLLGIAVYTAIRFDWLNFLVSVLTFFLTFLPTIIEKRYKIDFPSEFEILILFFIFGSIVLGEFSSFYDRFWWWDIMLHTLSGIIFGGIGFYLVYILNREMKSKVELSPLFVAIFASSFAISLGVFWEIFEFSMDSFFSMNMQRSGLVDTMWDLIVDSVGAIIVSVLGALWIKSDIHFIDFLENKFFLKNGDEPS